MGKRWLVGVVVEADDPVTAVTMVQNTVLGTDQPCGAYLADGSHLRCDEAPVVEALEVTSLEEELREHFRFDTASKEFDFIQQLVQEGHVEYQWAMKSGTDPMVMEPMGDGTVQVDCGRVSRVVFDKPQVGS